ncbi:MAG: CoA transferase, partial [Pseudomonadota bacterium]
GLEEWANDPSLAANNDRVARRDDIMPRIRTLFSSLTKNELMARLEETGLPFAAITKPEELIHDPHLTASGGLLETKLPEGGYALLPNLPVSFDDERLALELDPPMIGAHTEFILKSLEYTSDEIERLVTSQIVQTGPS